MLYSPNLARETLKRAPTFKRVAASEEKKKKKEASGAPLSLLSHIFPIFLTINMEKLNKTHISTLLAKWQLSHTEEASHLP